MTHFKTVTVGVALATGLLLQACYYPPPPTPVVVQKSPAEKFEASWQAARGAASDVGVSINREDRATGTLQGTKGSSNVNITVAPRNDGTVQVAVSVTAPTPAESADLKNRVTNAYQRRMGR
jgi:hypothetical protein